MYELLIGIEIEAAYNPDFLSISQGNYHRATFGSKYSFGKYFVSEGDSSLKPMGKHSLVVEFVSKPFLCKDLKKVIKDFKDTTIIKTDKSKLDDVFNFNASCGCHINISLLKKDTNENVYISSDRGNIEIKNKKIVPLAGWINHKMLVSIRNSFEKKVLNNWGEDNLKTFQKHYDRSYAQLCLKKLNYKQKYSELHIREFRGRIEFRGFHLLNVNTWEGFEWYLENYVETIKEELFKELQKEKRKFEEMEDIKIEFVVKYKQHRKERKELI